MKKVIFFILTFIRFTAFGSNLFDNNFTVGSPGLGELLFYNNILYVWIEDIAKPRKISIDSIKLNNHGYYEVDLETYSLVLIPGENKFEYFIASHYEPSDRYSKWRKRLFPNINNEYRGDINIVDITATSHFEEVLNDIKLEYKAEYLLDRYTTSTVGHDNKFSNFSLPWVEEKKDDGIGESIIIKFRKKAKEISILNGYIDIGNMPLYKENNRLKTIEIISHEISYKEIIEFDDEVKYTKIKLPKEVFEVELIIKEVYKGTKYSDTVVSGILAISQDVSYKEESIKYFIERAEILD